MAEDKEFKVPEEYEKYFSHHHEHGLTLPGDEVPHPKYSHVHSPEHKKMVLNRLAKAIGHLEHVKRMVEVYRYSFGLMCRTVLVFCAPFGSAKLVQFSC